MDVDYQALKQFCQSEAQINTIEALIKAGSQEKAAKALGKNTRSVSRMVACIRRNAAKHGYDPENGMNHPAKEGMSWKKSSILTDNRTGEQILEWNIYGQDEKKQIEAMEIAAKVFAADLPKIKLAKYPLKRNQDIIPWINIGDAHLGMIAFDKEVGQSFDIKIAKRELCAAMGMMIDRLEPCERLVVQDMGDMTHYENFAAKTEASGHEMDFDSRYPWMIEAYVETMKFIVEKALEKARYVDVIINQGNHSRTNDIWMAVFLRHMYEHTGRVNVLDNSSVFIPYRMGNMFVMCHHSDKCKPNRLAQVMTTDFRQDWGETEYHCIDIGHIHHHMVSKEHPGVKIESFNQLATMDKYAHDAGYRSRSSLTVIERSKTYGEIGRKTLPLEMVRDNILKSKPGTHAQIRREVHTV